MLLLVRRAREILVLVATAALLALVSRSRVGHVNVDDVIVWQVTTLTERSDYNFFREIRSYHCYRLLHLIDLLQIHRLL